MSLHRKKVLNSILKDGMVKPVHQIFKKVFGEGSSNDRFSVDDTLLHAPVLPVSPKDIPKIPEEDQLLKDDEVQSQLHETDKVQSQLPEEDEFQDLEDEFQDLEDLDSELLQDEDQPDAVIYKSTRLFSDGVVEPHVRVWSNRPCAMV